jgi:3-oxoacyl-[acyl-carrier protein] reductase
MEAMKVDLYGQTALVTGAGRGIGRAIASVLAGAGARVFLAARTTAQLKSTVRELRQNGGAAVAVPTDLSKEEDIQSLFQRIRDEAGGLDILVNNAGVGFFGPLAEFSSSDFDRVMQVNIKAVFLCCQQALRLMIPLKKGYIINISSVVGFKGYPNQAAYTASKHAVMGLTKSLAVEAQEHGIRVSAVLPGGVDTKMIAEARPDLDPTILLQPADIAHTVLYLLSLPDRAAVDQIYIRRRGSQPF